MSALFERSTASGYLNSKEILIFLNTFQGKHAQHDTPLASLLSIYKYIHIQPPQSPIIQIYFAETQVPVLADTCGYVW